MEDIDGEAIRESFSKSIVKVDGLFTSAYKSQDSTPRLGSDEDSFEKNFEENKPEKEERGGTFHE